MLFDAIEQFKVHQWNRLCGKEIEQDQYLTLINRIDKAKEGMRDQPITTIGGDELTAYRSHFASRPTTIRGTPMCSGRAFMFRAIHRDTGNPYVDHHSSGSIHYFDPNAESPTLTTFRAMKHTGRGGRWKGHEITSPFNMVKFMLTDRQFVHPDEHDHWARWLQNQREERARREEKEIAMRGRPWHSPTAPKPFRPPSVQEEREGTCRGCLKKTRDWITYDGATQTCWCRKCYYPRGK